MDRLEQSVPEANLSSLEHRSCEPPEQTVFSVSYRWTSWGQSWKRCRKTIKNSSLRARWSWRKSLSGYLNKSMCASFSKSCGFLKAQFFSQGVQWEPLCPAGGPKQSAADCDSRERVSDVFKLATGVSWIYLSRVVAFHICMHTSHAYTHSHALAWCFTLSWDQSGLAVWQPLGGVYLPQTPLQMFASLLFLPPIFVSVAKCMFLSCS